MINIYYGNKSKYISIYIYIYLFKRWSTYMAVPSHEQKVAQPRWTYFRYAAGAACLKGLLYVGLIGMIGIIGAHTVWNILRHLPNIDASTWYTLSWNPLTLTGPGAVAEWVERGCLMREIAGWHAWSSQTNDLSNWYLLISSKVLSINRIWQGLVGSVSG